MLHSTLPQTEAQAAVIARVRQLTDFCWTPLRDVPTYLRTAGNIVLPAGVPITGFPYASTEVTDKFFCENVSFESFVTAISNPDSKLYQPGQAAFNACNYGIVCNGVARYALGIHRRVSTLRWHVIPGMNMVKPAGEYTFEDMQLCDVLLCTLGSIRNHVAMITDLLRDENGVIQQVEVSEAIRPHCTRRRFDREEYEKMFGLFGLWRYEYLEDAPPFDTEQDKLLHSGFDKVTPAITVDNGNHSNYLVSQQVIISTFLDTDDVIEIYRNGELTESRPIGGRALIPYYPEEGHYTLKLQKNGGCVEFCVCDARFSHKSENGTVTVKVEGYTSGSRILYFDFRQAAAEGAKASSLEKYEELTEEEKRSGTWTRAIPEGGAHFKVYFENKYGIWTLPMRAL